MIDRGMDRQINGQMDKWIDRGMDGQMNVIDRQKDKQIDG